MEKLLTCVLTGNNTKGSRFRELRKLFDTSPERAKKLSNQLSLTLSVYSSIDNEAVTDFALLCKRVLRDADEDLKLLLIICIFRILPLKAYQSKEAVSLIEEAYDLLKMILECKQQLKKFADPLYRLALKQGKNYYASVLHYSDSSGVPHSAIKEILELFLMRTNLKEQDFDFMNDKNTSKEWIGYLNLLKDMGPLVDSILVNQFRHFLFNILPAVHDMHIKVFEWINEIISYLAVNISENIVAELVKGYEKLHSENETFKKAKTIRPYTQEDKASLDLTKPKNKFASKNTASKSIKGACNSNEGQVSSRNRGTDKSTMAKESTVFPSKSNVEETKKAKVYESDTEDYKVDEEQCDFQLTNMIASTLFSSYRFR
eukprot:TRINITY_DN383_c0_g4_i2.p1 TRINITY_DN383_c0_g4~~TRINITY_DN383_c0_g4_i2.p1  ORF type:complete len:374 (+),score=47.02 TRINITY_DN383_c0_g4_i2:114-1235(+)